MLKKLILALAVMGLFGATAATTSAQGYGYACRGGWYGPPSGHRIGHYYGPGYGPYFGSYFVPAYYSGPYPFHGGYGTGWSASTTLGF